jgi:hypothetical protein
MRLDSFGLNQDWQETVYVTDYCEVGVVVCKKSGTSQFFELEDSLVLPNSI